MYNTLIILYKTYNTLLKKSNLINSNHINKIEISLILIQENHLFRISKLKEFQNMLLIIGLKLTI